MIFLLFTVSIGFAQDFEVKKTTRSYKILKISETERYYVVEGESEENPVILVVDKKSDQLKDKKLEKGTVYKFKTYSFWDVMALGGPYYHEVDGVEVWSSDDHPTVLHFSDGMGNEYFEED